MANYKKSVKVAPSRDGKAGGRAHRGQYKLAYEEMQRLVVELNQKLAVAYEHSTHVTAVNAEMRKKLDDELAGKKLDDELAGKKAFINATSEKLDTAQRELVIRQRIIERQEVDLREARTEMLLMDRTNRDLLDSYEVQLAAMTKLTHAHTLFVALGRRNSDA